MMLVLVFNSRKRYRVNLLFPFHDVFLYFIFFIVNKLCLCFMLSRARSMVGLRLVYIIAWARGQLRINFTRIKVFTKLPVSRSDEGNL